LEDRLREETRERFAGRCGYCGVHEDDAGATLTVDHHRPLVHGGDDHVNNLVYACARCNEHKGSYWHEQDPRRIPLLHPGRDDLTAHLREEEDGRIVASTPEGQFFVQRLRLNRPQLVTHRRELRGRSKLHEELAAMTEHAHALEQRVNELSRTIDSIADDLERE
jgi:hypothetical protein